MAEENGIDAFPKIGLKAANFKCFRDAQGFDSIEMFNVIIGKNNAGKSTLIDMIQYAVKPTNLQEIPAHKGSQPLLYFELLCDLELILNFSEKLKFAPGPSYEEWSKQNLAGAKLHFPILEYAEKSVFNAWAKPATFGKSNLPDSFIQQLYHIYKSLENKINKPFQKHEFRRIVADRDIKPEKLNPWQSLLENLEPNGDNATRLITRYLQQDDLDRSLVESKLVNELNKVSHPDATFTRIVPLQRRDEEWEIYLEEKSKGLIPMSGTGSGIKTLLLVMLNLYLMPDVIRARDLRDSKRLGNKRPGLQKFLFGFEELENNLHPSLQRRLFLYLRSVAEQEKCKFFITTHSHVVIDLFSRDEHAQIIHVTHDRESAKVQRVETYNQSKSIFKDLDVRASDLFQTNAVVWVEGPSDRIYFNRWIQLWTDGELKEHVDYEVCFTGGTLLSHYTYDNPNVEEESLIRALRINQNAIILIDSDKSDDDTKLKPRVQRVVDEVKSMNGIAWVTSGNEIENYIPVPVFGLLLNKEGAKPESQYNKAIKYIHEQGGRNYSNAKLELAVKVCELLTREMIECHLDLKERLEVVCLKIRDWNNRTILNDNANSMV